MMVYLCGLAVCPACSALCLPPAQRDGESFFPPSLQDNYDGPYITYYLDKHENPPSGGEDGPTDGPTMAAAKSGYSSRVMW